MKSRLTEIMVTDCPSDRAERKNERVSELASEAESGKAKSQFYSQLESPGTQVSRALETFWLHAGGRQQCAAIFPDCVHQAGQAGPPAMMMDDWTEWRPIIHGGQARVRACLRE